MAQTKRTQALLQFALLGGILFFINILANYVYTHFDLTEEKRYTLTKPTRELMRNLKDRIYVEVLLEGEFPAGFKRLQTATRELLDDLRSETSYLDYKFEDPLTGSSDAVKSRQEALRQDGIMPTSLRLSEQGSASQKLIYPTVIVHYGSTSVPVNLLENNSPTLMPDEVINNSVSLLEYKLANAIKKVLSNNKPYIFFSTGHGELNSLQTKDLERGLRQFYSIGRINFDSVGNLTPKTCALLVIAKPRFTFSEKDKFKIDQYVMNGGRILWLIDRLGADLDSLRSVGARYLPLDYPLAIEDMLFKYGVRIQPDLVLDLECTKIPLQVGVTGSGPQFELFPWFYHPAVLPMGKHPIVKNLDRVELKFCSTIDTIRTKTPVKKTPLIRTSRYSRLVFSPIDLSFNIVREQPDPKNFDKGSQIVGVLLEGIFPSNYENRVSDEMMSGLSRIGVNYKAQSEPTRMLVISDGDVAANFVRDSASKEYLPLGFNRFEKNTYANRDLLLNSIEYLIEPQGVIEARSKEVKLRLLDTVRAKSEKKQWQLLNVGLPLVLLALFAILFLRLRKRRYAS